MPSCGAGEVARAALRGTKISNFKMDFTHRNGEFTRKSGDLTSKHSDLTGKNGDLSSKNPQRESLANKEKGMVWALTI